MICQLASLNNYIINWSLRQRQQSLSWRYFNRFGMFDVREKTFWSSKLFFMIIIHHYLRYWISTQYCLSLSNIMFWKRSSDNTLLKTVRKLISKLWRTRSRKTIRKTWFSVNIQQKELRVTFDKKMNHGFSLVISRHKCIHCKDTLFQRYVIDMFQISLTICNSWTKWKIFSQLHQ